MGSRKIVLSQDLIDQNGHVGEPSYSQIGIGVLWEMNKEFGTDKRFLSEGIAPVTFETFTKFKRELLVGEEVEVKIDIYFDPNKKYNWRRIIEIFNHQKQLSCSMESSGAFIDLKLRKLAEPAETLIQAFLNTDFCYLEDK